MKNTLVIGSTVTDIVIRVPRLPVSGEDINIISQHQQLGGCAYNVSHILKLTKTPYILCSPVGSGVFGDFVDKQLQLEGVQPFIKLHDIPNGCCYCIVDSSGERTFLSHHGAEYIFHKEWMNKINPETVDSVFVCGIELEEPTGEEILSYLEEHPEYLVFFAPGPRITKIPKPLMDRMIALKPVFHMNYKEVTSFMGVKSPEEATKQLHSLTKNRIITTLGRKGAFCIENNESFLVPGVPAKIEDTIGAGDAHLGAIISSIKYAIPLEQAVRRANLVAAAVVSVSGASLTEEQFNKNCRHMKIN
ncbi:MAG: carbohydrate kinase family protein [Spirochaetaceae bacterium]|nr:carbohydrate kinase family protein [Spirochaetaceae bacterium]